MPIPNVSLLRQHKSLRYDVALLVSSIRIGVAAIVTLRLKNGLNKQ